MKKVDGEMTTKPTDMAPSREHSSNKRDSIYRNFPYQNENKRENFLHKVENTVTLFQDSIQLPSFDFDCAKIVTVGVPFVCGKVERVVFFWKRESLHFLLTGRW